MYTLWRNGQLLGQVHEQPQHSGSKPGFTGMLEPTAAFTGISPMMQVSCPPPWPIRNMQHHLEVIDFDALTELRSRLQ